MTAARATSWPRSPSISASASSIPLLTPAGMPLSHQRSRRPEALPRRLCNHILSHMANKSVSLSELFYALGDPTRLAIVGELGRGPASVSALAAPFAMALPSFMKHLTVLERMDVIRSNKVGRVRTCELRPKALTQAEQWLASQRAVWEGRLDRLDDYVMTLMERQNDDS